MWVVLAGVWLCLTGAAAAVPVPVTVDLTAADPLTYRGVVAGALQDHCDGRDRDVLAVAAVLYSKADGPSMWGHASMRFVVCDAGKLRDLEYEYYRFDDTSGAHVARRYRGFAFAQDGAYLRSLRGGLLLHRNEGTVDGGFYQAALTDRREIYELWLDLDAAERRDLWQRAEQRYADQLGRFLAREPLEYRYVALGRNCTYQLQSDLIPGPIMPFMFYRKLQRGGDVRLVVLHPSAHVLSDIVEDHGGAAGLAAAVGSGAVVIDRPRPLLRRSGLRTGEREALAEQLAGRVGPAVDAVIPGDESQGGRAVAP